MSRRFEPSHLAFALFPFDKTSPAAAAVAIVAGVEAGSEEIFPDPMSQGIGAAYLADPNRHVEVEAQRRAPPRCRVGRRLRDDCSEEERRKRARSRHASPDGFERRQEVLHHPGLE